MRVSVTKFDIRQSRMRNSALCPIVYALRRMGHPFVYVGTDAVKIFDRIASADVRDRNKVKRAKLSKRARKFVEDFELGKKVTPFTLNLKFGKFRLTIPEWGL